MTPMIRKPAVAHQFYPGDPKSLQDALAALIPAVAEKKKALAVIAPHAGYVYSGAVAGETFAAVRIPKDILVMGPNHHGYGAPAALMREGSWRTPLGPVPLNGELADLLLAESENVEEDELAHRLEHSLEVQIPFLQYLRPDITLTPLVLSRLSFAACREIGLALARAITRYDREVLLVASSDMSHYESRQSATARDRLALQHILALDPEGLYRTVDEKRISMCGVIPATVALIAALELGAGRAELVRYTDSGETSGDIGQVVGYAGCVIA